MTSRPSASKRAHRLTVELGQWFGRPLAALPPRLRALVERRWATAPDWDRLTARQRRVIAEQLDAQDWRVLDAVERQEAEEAFRAGFARVSIPRRNRRNARRLRPSRQKVSDAEIARLKAELEAEGLKAHKQVAEAHRRLSAAGIRISLRGLRYRWAKKGS